MAGCLCNACCVGIKMGSGVKNRRLQEKFENIETVEDAEQFYEDGSGKKGESGHEGRGGFKEWKEEEHPPMVREGDEGESLEKEKL